MRKADRNNFIVSFCRNKKVLNCGCMSHPFTQQRIDEGNHLHLNLLKKAKFVVGIDTNLSNRNLLPADTEDSFIFVGDVSNKKTYQKIKDIPFDIVIMGELLEHLENPGLALRYIKDYFPQAILIVTVPNCFGWFAMTHAQKQIERVHPEHVCWYSPKTIKQLLNRCGYNNVLMYGFGIDKKSVGFHSNGILVVCIPPH